MINVLPMDNLIKYIEKNIGLKISSTKIPPQGMSSSVFFISSDDNKEYAVKYGKDAMNDVPALELISKEQIDIPIGKLYKAFKFEDLEVIILEKINYPLLETVSRSEIEKYIPSMIENLKKLHQVKSLKPGLLTEPESNKTWKQMILSKFDGTDFNWEQVSNRKGLDKDLILLSVRKVIDKINKANLNLKNFSLLHTDFNQRNLFVDPNNNKITGIIDWEEAMFGDPIFDFARVRMYIWHFNLDNNVIENYYKLMNYNSDQRELEELYWLIRVIEYLAWYSEDLNEFNVSRIKLHQDFLRKNL